VDTGWLLMLQSLAAGLRMPVIDADKVQALYFAQRLVSRLYIIASGMNLSNANPWCIDFFSLAARLRGNGMASVFYSINDNYSFTF